MGQLWDRFVTISNSFGDDILRKINRLIARASVLPEQPFYDSDAFPWVHDLEANWKVIRRELDDVLAYHADLPNFQEISTDQLSITDDDWPAVRERLVARIAAGGRRAG